jgi:hypothetical protein
VERLGAARVDAAPRRLGLGRTLNDRALYPYSPATPEVARRCEREVKGYVSRLGWTVEPVPINVGMIRQLLSGEWNTDRFVLIVPGQNMELEVATEGLIRDKRQEPEALNLRS